MKMILSTCALLLFQLLLLLLLLLLPLLVLTAAPRVAAGDTKNNVDAEQRAAH